MLLFVDACVTLVDYACSIYQIARSSLDVNKYHYYIPGTYKYQVIHINTWHRYVGL